MRKKRILAILLVSVLGLGLLAVSMVAAQEGENNPPEAATQEVVQPQPLGAGGSNYPLFVGTGAFNVTTTHDAYVMDVTTNMSMPVFAEGSVWGATYDPAGRRVLFTSYAGGVGGEGNALWMWPRSGGTPTQLGVITAANGLIRIDGLAMSGGTLYGWQQFSRPGGPIGLYEIDMSGFTATLVFTGNVDMSGIDADPETGILYGTADGTNDLVQIGLNGVITSVAPYPDPNETDIDGLAVGGGKAYLIPDDNSPGLIYVYDFASSTFETPLNAPWTGSETFAAGAWIFGPDVMMTKTVGTTPGACAPTDSLVVPAGTDVQYCYEVENTGSVTLTLHDLVDSELGAILSGFSFTLTPGTVIQVLPAVTTIDVHTVNTAVWTSYNPGPTDVVSRTDSAEVMVADIAIAKTPDVQTVASGGDANFTVAVTNTGDVTLTNVMVSDPLVPACDNSLGDLAPGASSSYACADMGVTSGYTNTAEATGLWMKQVPITDTDTALVMVEAAAPAIVVTKTVGTDPGMCATTDTLVVDQPSTDVTYCYTVMNTGNVTLTTHDVEDDQLGTLASGLAYDLGPGESTSITATATITESVTNVVTWTASVPGGPSAMDTDTATVTETPTDVSLTGFGGESVAVAPVWLAVMVLALMGAVVALRRRFVR